MKILLVLRRLLRSSFHGCFGPLIIKNKVALPVVEILPMDMNFKKSFAVNYDPHHVISQRRQLNKNKEFEHPKVEGLTERTNWMDYQDR